MQGAEDRRLRRMNYTPQGGVIEGNAADDIFLVDQGSPNSLTLELFMPIIVGYGENLQITHSKAWSSCGL